MIKFMQAIHNLYPEVVRIVGEDAFDVDGNIVASSENESDVFLRYIITNK